MATYNKFATIGFIFFCFFFVESNLMGQKSQAEIKQEINGHIKMLEEYLHKPITMDLYFEYMSSKPSNLVMFEDMKKTMLTSPAYEASFVEEHIKALKAKLTDPSKPAGKD